ncbi:MAG: T9SS type A sorting domain-containing protein [Chitinophagales bacterium]|nr:T9SS type A sorting domain-containing protein [Chitinophagales bacterium]MDW8427438.1 T9SS type A sorting domain-containing protein [Chitinophagales bacterium]
MRCFCSLLFVLTFATAFGQACIPNNDTVSGIEPDTLAPAFVNIPYEETIYFRLPADTVVDLVFGNYVIYDVLLCIDSLTIDSVKGLPAGFTYGCHVPWCSVKGGQNGCAKISGTATQNQIGIHPLQVFVTIYVNDCYTFSLPPTPDTITFFFLQVLPQSTTPPVHDVIEGLGTPYPNPAHTYIHIPFTLKSAAPALFRITDLAGRVLMEQKQQPSAQVGEILLHCPLPAGTYLLEMISASQRYRKTIVIAGP